MNEHPSMDQLLLDRLNEAIENNLDNEQFGVEDLAKESGLSRSQLHRKLNSLTGQSASQMIREFRLKKAMELLQDNTATVAEISYLVGFGSPTYFNTCFNDYFGYSPGEVKLRKTTPRILRQSISKRSILISLSALILLVLVFYTARFVIAPATRDLGPMINDRSIAVLPFVNVSDDPEHEALCDGLTVDMIHHLGGIRSFTKVISRSSVMSLKNSNKKMPEIATELKVNLILECSFQQIGDSIKIIAALIDAVNDNQLWSDSFERHVRDILEIQSDIATQIAARLKAEITDEEKARLNKKPTESLEAYILLKKGLYKFWDRPMDLQGAIDLFKKAIEKDPELAEGYAALADAYLTADISFLGDKSIPVENPLSLVQKALDLDPELAEGYRIFGDILCGKEWNFSKAEAAYKTAVELDPQNSWSKWHYASFLVQMGRAAEGLPYQEKAVELDPTDPGLLIELSKFYFYAGNKEKAAEMMDEYESLFRSENLGGWLGLTYFYLNKLEKAIEYLENDKENILHSSFLAIAYTKNGQDQKAQPLLDRLKLISEENVGTSPEYSVGLYYSGTGQKEKALDWLERAYNSHDTELYWLKTEPMFKTLHGDPRYEKLLRKIGFPE